jgi:chromosome segregation ATPase
MTNEELVKGLRQNALWVTTHEAADRIEQLEQRLEATKDKAEAAILDLMAERDRAEARIEELKREQIRLHTQCDGLMQSAMNNGQALIIAEALLAKAVEALHLLQAAADEGKRLWAEAEARVAELEAALAETTEAFAKQLGNRKHIAWAIIRRARATLRGGSE